MQSLNSIMLGCVTEEWQPKSAIFKRFLESVDPTRIQRRVVRSKYHKHKRSARDVSNTTITVLGRDQFVEFKDDKPERMARITKKGLERLKAIERKPINHIDYGLRGVWRNKEMGKSDE